MTASELTQTVSEMLADTVNALSDGEDVSASMASTAALVGALYNATVGGSGAPHKSMTIAAMLAGTRNALSDDPDVSSLNVRSSVLLAQIANELSGTSNYSSLTHTPSQLLAAICTAAEAGGGGGPDFDGLTAGSAVGELGNTGSLPTGWGYSLDGVSVTVDEATHDVGGVESITITAVIAEAGEGIIYFPDFQLAASGQTWRVYLHASSVENIDMETIIYGIAEFDAEDGGLDFNSEAIAEGLNDFEHALAPEAMQARGEIFVASAVPSSLTMTFAAKLEQVS